MRSAGKPGTLVIDPTWTLNVLLELGFFAARWLDVGMNTVEGDCAISLLRRSASWAVKLSGIRC